MKHIEEFIPGVFLIDKPAGPSSFTMVRGVRRLLGIKKVGHAGTLDPFASGLLIICAGRPATKLIDRFMAGDKEYLATLKLGVETTTHDPEGDIVSTSTVPDIPAEMVDRVLAGFTGELLQSPPAYSACKHKGKPLYYYARKGIEIKKEPRKVQIHSISWCDRRACVSQENAEIVLRIVCSKGTYVRTLAADIGKKLGTGAYLTALRRTQSGIFTVDDAFNGELLQDRSNCKRLIERRISVETVQNMLQ